MNTQDKNQVKRKAISLETKIAILDRLAKGEGCVALGKEYGFGVSTIRSIQKRASDIYNSYNSATKESLTRVCYSRNILIEKTEKELVLWIQQQTQQQHPIQEELIKDKAKQLYDQLAQIEPCSSQTNIKCFGCNAWLADFLRRHPLEKLNMKSAADHNNSKEFAELANDNEYCTDESGLAHKKLLRCEEVAGIPATLIDFLNSVLKDYNQEASDSLTESDIYAGLQLWNKLENHFLTVDNNTERTLKFKSELQSSMSVYCDLYKRLTNKRSTQKLITDYYTAQQMSPVMKFEIGDEREFFYDK